MASKIRVLNENTINKIAAGEVIENPASVVKELVENSLDAGATEICVEVMGGGRQLIRISDNGCGMNGDDALLCLERHATSKIRNVEDISDISTMGFRGEAIPSIASISKFTLITRPAPTEEGDSNATMVIVDGGNLIKCCGAERSPGTTIEVKSLFFNIPVRKKFQKSPTYDSAEILKTLSVLSLGNPSIKFKLISNHQTELSTPGVSSDNFLTSLGERISDTLGSDYFSSLVSFEEKTADFQLVGYLGKPHYHRHNRTGQYLFINQRPVFSPMISNLVREGYGPTLPTNRYPVFVLHLSLPGSYIDVNVHPQKREVRLRYEQAFRQTFIQAIEKGLRTEEQHTPHFYPGRNVEFSLPTERFAMREPLNRPPIEDYFKEDMERFSAAEIYPPPAPLITRVKQEEIVPITDFLPIQKRKSPPKVLTTLGHYILSTSEDEEEKLVLYDQQLVHQRIFYELCLQQQQVNQEVQSLLIPAVLDFSTLEGALLREYLPELRTLGINIEELRPNTFIIEAIPTFIDLDNIQETISTLVNNLNEFQDHGMAQAERNRLIALSASRAALLSKKRLTVETAQILLNRLMQCENKLHCPFGKPIRKTLGVEEIRQYFQKN